MKNFHLISFHKSIKFIHLKNFHNYIIDITDEESYYLRTCRPFVHQSSVLRVVTIWKSHTCFFRQAWKYCEKRLRRTFSQNIIQRLQSYQSDQRWSFQRWRYFNFGQGVLRGIRQKEKWMQRNRWCRIIWNRTKIPAYQKVSSVYG